jgi:hypothetical protein
VLRIIRNFFCVASSNGRAAARDSTEPSVWLPRINRYLAVPRSLVKLLILLKRRDLARSHSIAELLPLEFHEYKWAANGEQTSCKWRRRPSGCRGSIPHPHARARCLRPSASLRAG